MLLDSEGNVWECPEVLNFHVPMLREEREGDQVDDKHVSLMDVTNSPNKHYRQLVCWCLIQRYWYYVIGEPKAKDQEYDMIEQYVKELEEELGVINPHSPSRGVGSDIPWSYPRSIVMMFEGTQSLARRLLSVGSGKTKEHE